MQHNPQMAGIPQPGVPGVPAAPGVPGVPMQPFAPQPGVPSAPGVPPMSPSSNVMTQGASRVNLEDSIAAVAYIAYQTNYIKKGVIKATEARAEYKAFFEAQKALANDDPNKAPAEKNTINNKGKEDPEKTTELVENYSATRYRTYLTKNWEEMKAKGYCEIVMSESKAEYFVLKALVPADANAMVRSSITDKLRAQCAARVATDNLFVVRRSNLLSYMASAVISSLRMYNDVSKIGTAEDPDGYVLFREKKSKAVGSENSRTFLIRYIRLDQVEGEAYNATVPKEILSNYAINRDMTADRGKVCDDQSKILNLERFHKLFPEVENPEQVYGRPVDYTKNSTEFSNDEERMDAKSKTVIPYDERFKAIGLTEKALEALRTPGGGGGGGGSKPLNLTKLIEDSQKASALFMSGLDSED